MDDTCGWKLDADSWVLPEEGGFTATAKIELGKIGAKALKAGDKVSLMG